MKVIHPETSAGLEGGIKTSLDHQKRCLERRGIEYTEEFDEDADVLHLNILGPRDLYYMKRARRHSIPVVVHTHEIGENFRESFLFSSHLAPLVKRYVDYFYRRADLLVCPTEYAAKTLEERGIDTPKKVVSNGIKKERFEGIDSWNSEYATEKFQAINVSIIFERKGLSDFISVAENLEDIQFTWFGTDFGRFTGSNVGKKKKNSPENCRFPGFVEDVRDCFAAGDVFFFPTKSETQGLSVVEAGYCGLPIVVRDIPVYEDMFEHGENCLKADSVEGFIEAIERLEEDEELRKKLAENARELAEEHLLENVAPRLEDAYRTVTG